MPTLLFLNGPPASGKSTIAARLVAERPMAFNLDIDTIRGLLGAWLDHPSEAGLLARELALVMARTHLVAGHDVVIPQFVGRPEFLERLEQLASSVGARFVEIALVMDRWDAVDAFAEHRAAPHGQAHLDAAALVDHPSWMIPSARCGTATHNCSQPDPPPTGSRFDGATSTARSMPSSECSDRFQPHLAEGLDGEGVEQLCCTPSS